ncbi:ATP-binding cassette domain-containing protein [Lactococcus cremoris]|uniref:Energy-coupling factor transporter ATPase n=1 Tax=Lactococcus lactis subsp. cremoris TaxID=1359 RepID=A0ABR5ECH6_LACLC|nr:energy-coupling factor transporter ATPase [Lactococcus cremoris]
MRYINVENLTFYYDREPVLENISYHVDSGEFVTLTGENGAAKSTLIKTTLGILKPKKGKITISSKIIEEKSTIATFRSKLQVLTQDSEFCS